MNAPEIAKELEEDLSYVTQRIYKLNLNYERDPKVHQESINRSYQNSSTRSKGEQEIEEIYPTDFKNDHNIIGWELDLWYPEQRVAIEYNGEYWHSSACGKAGKHIAKATICEGRGIHLINIFERFWKNKKSKAKIINILDNNLSREKLRKVKGEIREVHKEEAQEFIRKNNIDSVISADWHIGTYSSEGTLLNLLSLDDDGYTINIKRFTTKVGYQENYKELINYLKKYKEVSWINVSCNRLYYDGSLFTSLGFEHVGKAKPEFYYIHGDIAISRSTYNKNPEKYENYYKVYDCGRLRLKLTL